VIGINSQIETGGSGSDGSVGIGFAIPVNTVKDAIPLMQKGNVEQAYLGISTTTIDASLSQLNLPVQSGALVESVQPNSPAASAGLQAGTISATVDENQVCLGGDIIVSVNGQTVTTNDDLQNLIGAHKPGDKVTLGIVRASKHISVQVTLAARPTTAPQAQSSCGGA
jgi:S1-C subfamily serine protease